MGVLRIIQDMCGCSKSVLYKSEKSEELLILRLIGIGADEV